MASPSAESKPSLPDNGESSRSEGHDGQSGSEVPRQQPESKKTEHGLWSRTKKVWARTGLDITTMKIMSKGALAPTIALSAYQATPFANEFTTIGYLVGIISILSFAIMPRAKFLQTMFYLVLTTCAATALALLEIYCCVQARTHTTNRTAAGTGGAGTSGTPSPGAQTAAYNSSASAVAAIWLFFEIYLVNALRARNPALTIPGIVACIFANVASVYAPQFATMAQGISFAQRLLLAFLTGQGIGTGVSLFIFPITVRGVVFKEFTGYIMTLRKLMKANQSYVESLETSEMFNRTPTGQPDKPRSPEASAIKSTLAGLAALHGKLSVDLVLAKKEIAIGKLGPDDLQDIFRRLRTLLQPLIGLSSVVDVFERITEEHGWDQLDPVNDNQPLDDISDPEERLHRQSVEEWHQLSGMLKAPFQEVIGHLDEGFAHVLYTLQLVPRPRSVAKSEDIESKSDVPSPGDSAFTTHLAQKVQDFQGKKTDMLRHYIELRGIDLSPDFFENPRTADFSAPDWYYKKPEASSQRFRFRRQLYLVLYMDYLLGSIGKLVVEFCQFADTKAEGGKLSKNRLIVPGVKRFRKWVMTSVSSRSDAYSDEQHGMNEDGSRASNIYLGDAFSKRKDPEHLPPANGWERLGNRFRGIAGFMRSPASAFGFRVACATMCLAIIAYLHDTQVFYVRQRLFWAQIMVTISMSPSAGQSIFSFFLRIAGTFVAMCTSFIIWYIVDGHTAGVLAFYWFTVMWGFYIVLKYPRITPSGMIFSVTNTLIIGYELQVRKIGVAVSETNGQAVYPLYELAPYRLATVCAGIFVAWVWTMFPYPMAEHSELRKNLGSSLYLLANYYSIMQETVRARIQGEPGMELQNGPYQKLEKQRTKVFAKSVLVLQGLRTHANFVKFDLPIGGKFPKVTYNKLINRIQDILNFTSLIVFSSQTFSDMYVNGTNEHSESEWLRDFRRLIKDANSTSREVTTLLALLSASVVSGQPLPPYLKAPDSYALSAKLDALDKNILSVRHITEPGFAAFACMQIATKVINDDLKALLRDIKELVGELDFSFHVVRTSDSSPQSSQDSISTKDGKGKAD